MKFTLYKHIVFVFWLFCGILVLAASLKNEIIYENKTAKKIIFSLLPQGWGFFTKTPTEEKFICYNIKDGKIVRHTIKNSSSENMFGFSRKSRVIGYQTSQILGLIITDPNWKDSTGSYDYFIPKNSINIKPATPLTYFSAGKYIFIRFFPMPWAWLGGGQEKFRPYKYLLINITK